ncbi:MAG: sulfatase-like hydrolase/transferase [Fuerstiella sp.]|nr:sulfatase-like hydrolase/transferase [Fuerstiella sp.]MCP4855669.1 sulfatase-like hydrolase/transferase [Fuerstiella sp.]
MHIRSFAILLTVAITSSSLFAARPKNVVFILSDNQSYYEMSCHGHAQIKTPNIDSLAKQSVEFTHFYAEPYCSPTRTVILTGRHAMRSGVFTTVAGRSIMHRKDTTLADVLKTNGYSTAIFGKWHLGFSYPHRPQDRGFEEVFVHGGGGVGQMEDYYGNSLFDTTFIHNGKVSPSKGYCTDTLFDQAMTFVENHRHEPFFCFVSTPVTHSPHHGPKALVARLKAEGMTDNVELNAQVMNLDMNIGRMTRKLDKLGLAEDTLYIYASDQGMSDRGAPHGGLRITQAHDPAQHVPFFARLPGARPAVCNRLAGMIDFFPTVLDYCGIESPVESDGVSLMPLLTGADWPTDRTLIIHCPRNRNATMWKNASVKTERWRYTNGMKLYDIQADPRQQTDVAAQYPEVVRHLRAEYETFWESMPNQEQTLSRHLLGATACPDVVLNGMDWYKGASPWNRGAFQGQGNGAWAVSVVRDGRYVVECRHYPREAEKSAEASHARLKIGNDQYDIDVAEGATHATFDIQLKVGDYDLETFMTTADGKVRGALFVYVSAK